MRRFFIEDSRQNFWPHEHAAEFDFTKQIARCAEQLFDGYSGRPWSPIIRDGWGHGAQPDLLLISLDFELWYVVEVELVRHSLLRHIQPQLETLSGGIYDARLLDSLAAAFPEIERSRLQELIYREPGLLCIANDYTDGLHAVCRDLNFELAVLEPYRSRNGHWAINVSRLPAVFSPRAEAGHYQLRRGQTFGDKEWMELPRHFPNWRGMVRLIDEAGQNHDCQLFTGDPKTLVVPRRLLTPTAAAALIMVDRDRKILRLEIEQ